MKRAPIVETAKGLGPYLIGMLGLIARLREYVTGRLPSRAQWVSDFDAFLRAGSITGVDAASTFEALEYEQLKRSANRGGALLWFVEECLRGGLPELRTPLGRELLTKLVLPDAPSELVPAVAELISSAQQDKSAKPVEQAERMCMRCAKNLQGYRPPWAPGMRLFDWPSISVGFSGYRTLNTIDPTGLYLIVREARGWSTQTGTAPPTLVRDLLWINDTGVSAVRGETPIYGLHLSSFNRLVYEIRQFATAGGWHRVQGPPVTAEEDNHQEIEVAAPLLAQLAQDRPKFALLSAHTRDGGSAAVWKALIARVEEWGDTDDQETSFEIDLNTFFPNGPGDIASDEEVSDMIDHFERRGVIGAFGDPEATALFHRLVRRTSADTVAHHLRLIMDGAGPDADPITFLAEHWARIEPSAILLPEADEEHLTDADGELACKLLFAQDALHPDKVLAEKRLFAAAQGGSNPIAQEA